MSNHFYKKYNKYLQKNIILKKIIQTGGEKIVLHGVSINHENLTFLKFIGNDILTTRHASINGIIQYNPLYEIIVSNSQNNYQIQINDKSYTPVKPIMILSNDSKIFYLYKKDITIEITTNINQFDESSYFKSHSSLIKISKSDLELTGTCTISKKEKEKVIIDVIITKIGSEYSKWVCDIYDILRIIETRSIFDYEISYDIFKNINLSTFCPKSSVLLKNFYNSNFNLFFADNRNLYNYLKNNYGKILEKMLFDIMTNSKNSIFSLCENDDDREMLLKNVIKRIETHNPYIHIMNNTHTYIPFPKKFKVIFDTGNSSFSIIGKNIVDALSLSPHKTFIFNASGVGGAIAYNNGYVTLSIKFDKSSPYYLPHIYNFIAIIDDNNLKDTLLLGHSSKIFKDFLKNNYCVGYNYEKTHASIVSESNPIKTYHDIINLLDLLPKLYSNYKSTNNYDKLLEYLSNFINILNYIRSNLVNLVNLDNFDSDNIYGKVVDIFNNVQQIKLTPVFSQEYIKQIINVIDKIKIDLI
jgi:hypothetical protein